MCLRLGDRNFVVLTCLRKWMQHNGRALLFPEFVILTLLSHRIDSIVARTQLSGMDIKTPITVNI
jgi:hypothetical protein